MNGHNFNFFIIDDKYSKVEVSGKIVNIEGIVFGIFTGECSIITVDKRKAVFPQYNAVHFDSGLLIVSFIDCNKLISILRKIVIANKREFELIGGSKKTELKVHGIGYPVNKMQHDNS